MKIIDGHAHIASTRFIPMEFIEGVADNLVEQMVLSPAPLTRSKLIDHIIAGYQDHDGSLQVREMGKLGIEKTVALLPDFTYALPSSNLSIEEMYLEHSEILRRHPGKFEVFAGVDPRWGKDAFQLFVKGIERFGFRGLKLYPPCGYRPDSELLTPFYEYCNTFKLPVLLHIGPTSPALSFTEAMPIYIDEPARKYKNIPFILAHGAVNYQEQCIQLCKYRPNVYLDLSGAQFNTTNHLLSKTLLHLFSSGINHKIIFGTDWPVNKHASMNQRLIDMMSNERETKPYINLNESMLVLSGNIERILKAVSLPQQDLRYGTVCKPSSNDIKQS